MGNQVHSKLISSDIFNDPYVSRLFTSFELEARAVNPDSDPVEHTLNSHGFRSPEFSKVDLIMAGCSQTFGMGVEYNQTWPTMLAESLNASYVNLGSPGASNQKIVENIISYIKKYGKPKIICAVFPNLYRIRLGFNHRILTRKQKYRDKSVGSHVDDISLLSDTSRMGAGDKPKISKAPHEILDILPLESAVYLSMMSITHLIEYCRAADIVLKISTWEPDTHDVFELRRSLDREFIEYVPLDLVREFYSDPDGLSSCHSNIDGLANWFRAFDVGNHMGAHQHLHFSELFLKSLESHV